MRRILHLALFCTLIAATPTIVSAEAPTETSPAPTASQETQAATPSVPVEDGSAVSDTELPVVHTEVPLYAAPAAPPSDPRAAAELERQRRIAEQARIRAERERVRAERRREQEMRRAVIRANREKQKKEDRASGKSLIKVGGITLGAGYGVSLLVGMFMGLAEIEGSAYMMIPLIGPPLHVALKSDTWEADGSDRGFLGFWTCFPSVVQVVGLSLIVAGIVRKQNYAQRKKPYVSFLPTVIPNGGGGMLFVAF